MRWAPQGLHSRVADPVPTPQCRHGSGDFRPKRNCWRWVWQYSYTQRLPQISRELTLSQGQILIALIVAYDKSILPSKWKIPWIFSVREYCNYPWGVCRARWRVWCVVRRGGRVLGAAEGVLGGVVWGAVGVGAGGRGRGAGRGWCGVPWGRVLGAAEGVVGGVVRGAVGVGVGGCAGRGGGCGVRRRGGGCWEPWRGYWAGWCGVPWGRVLGAVAGVLGGVVGVPRGAGAGSRGGGAGRGGVGCRGGGCWEPRRGRAGGASRRV